MADYLAENEAFYARFWREEPGYRTRYPNAEEAGRAGAVLTFVSRIVERRGAAAPPLTLLDVGCGRGWLTNVLSVYGPIAGCDAAAGGVELARELFPTLTFHHGALGVLIDHGVVSPVSVLVSSEVLEHVPRVAQAQFVQELRRAILPGGHCIITTPRREVFDIAGDASAQQVEEWLTEREVEELFQASGFRAEQRLRIAPVNGYFPDRIVRRLQRVAPGLHAPAAVQAWLDTRSALYQAWWFSRAE